MQDPAVLYDDLDVAVAVFNHVVSRLHDYF